jgi:hypothetical protein
VKEDGPKRAGDDALLAGDAFLGVDIVDAVIGHNGIGGASIPALGFLAIATDDRHTDHRMRIDHHHPNAGFLGIVDPKALDGTDELAEATSRTALGNNSQFLRHQSYSHG